MRKVRVGIIGVGEIAQNFHLPIYYKLNNVSLEGVYDINTSKSKAIAEKYEITKVYYSLDDIINSDEIDAIDICTTTDTHAEIALKVIESGKHCLIEKPIAKNINEALLIYDASKKSNSKVMVGTNQRFRYDAMVLKNFVQTGEIGEIFYVKGSWLQQKRGKEWRQQIEKSGGGVLIDLGVSLIDSLLWICNYPDVQSVTTTTFKHLSNTVEDVCIGNIKFTNGMIATIEISWSLFTSKNTFSFDVHGSKGSASINPLQLFKSDGDIYQPIMNTDNLSNLSIHKKSFENEIKHFINAILGLNPIISTPEEALKTMKIIDMMYQSSFENKTIEI